MDAKLYGQNKGGSQKGLVINKIIQDYYVYAKENISAGDLVSFIDGIATKSYYGSSSSMTLIPGVRYYKALSLSENRVFIAYESTGGLYGVVYTINGLNIIPGTVTHLHSSGGVKSLCKLPNGNIFITHYYDGNACLGATICSVQGTTVTHWATQQLSTMEKTAYRSSSTVLSDGNVFVGHIYNNSSEYLYGIVVRVFGASMWCGADTALSSTTGTGEHMTCCAMANNKVFIGHSYSTDYLGYVMACRVQGTTITYGTDIKLAGKNYSGEAMIANLIPNDKILIVYRNSSDYWLWAAICTVSEDTLGVSIYNSTTLTSADAGTGEFFSVAMCRDNGFFIAHSYGGNPRYLYGMQAYYNNDNTITHTTDTLLLKTNFAGKETDVVLLSNNVLFLPYTINQTSPVYVQLWSTDNDSKIASTDIVATTYETQVCKTKSAQFHGVAKTSGQGSTGVAIQDVLKTGNPFPTTGWVEKTSQLSYTCNGYALDVSEKYNEDYLPYHAMDNSTGTEWYGPKGGISNVDAWLRITCPNPIKITKMIFEIGTHTDTTCLVKAVIQGSHDNSNWIDLYTTTSTRLGAWGALLDPVELSNTDFYQYYRVLTTVKRGGGSALREWYPTEYIDKEEVESFEHKDYISVYQPSHDFNLIPDGSFEGNIWSARNDAGGIQIVDTYSYNGERSLYFPVGQTIVPEIPIARPILGHKYYGRRYIKTNGDNQPADCRFEMYAGDGEGKNWVFAWNNGNHPNWDFDSAIQEVTVINYPETTQTIIRCFNVNTTAETWVDDLLLLDLTDLFGAGNEPTKDWCDANL